MPAPNIGLIVTGKAAAAEFQIFCKSLEVWHPDASLYLFTDTATQPLIAETRFKGTIHCRTTLDAYTGLTRTDMEARPGRSGTMSLWTEFMYEKAGVLEWMWEVQPAVKTEGAWFMDTDITHLAPLPTIPPHASVALSPHYIRDSDCRKFGKYNGGYLWMKDHALIQAWRDAGPTSRFYEQAALEYVAAVAAGGLYEFPIQVNFGWWRMYQGSESPPLIQSKFSIYRPDTSAGVRFDGAVLQSIHTHWHDKTSVTGAFNAWFEMWTRRFVTAHRPLAQLRSTIGMG